MAEPDGKPATSFNAMDREWVRAVAKEAGGLPEVSGSDNGDVLTVVSGEWATATPVAELPAVTGSDNGDVLTVVEGAWAKASPVTELPAVTSSDNGDVLTVVEGAWAKATPSGGGGGVLVVRDTDGYLDKTAQEILNALNTGALVALYYVVEDWDTGAEVKILPMTEVEYDANPEDTYYDFVFKEINTASNTITYSSDTAEGYPHAGLS